MADFWFGSYRGQEIFSKLSELTYRYNMRLSAAIRLAAISALIFLFKIMDSTATTLIVAQFGGTESWLATV
jgi:hypothetical protein